MRTMLIGLLAGMFHAVTPGWRPPPADTGSDTSDTSDTADTGDTGDTDDTGDTGADTGSDAGDTAEHFSASDMAEETGGCGCTSAPAPGALAGLLLLVPLVVTRRRED